MTVAEMTRTYTPEEFLRLPDNNTMELVHGQIVEKQVSRESSKIEGLVYFQFQQFLQEHPVAEANPASLGYRCFRDDPARIRRPDVTVVRLDRLRDLPDQDPGLMPIVPDLAVEVISPNDIADDVDEKVQEYLEAGFPLVWVVHPRTRAVVVHPLRGRPAIFSGDDEISAENAMPGFRCKVSAFFPQRIAK